MASFGGFYPMPYICPLNKSDPMPNAPLPPVAAKKPQQLEKHGDIRTDEYYWLNDRENPEVIDYLNQENEYYREMTAHTAAFQEELFQEIKSRIKEDDESVPYFYNGYWYIVRFETGKDYPVYTRRRGSLEAPEEVMFDCNEMAKGHSFFQIGGVSISPDNTTAVFGVDLVGRRIYTLRFKNLQTGEIFDAEIENAAPNCVWANDNRTVFYTRQDKKTLRPDTIYKHRLGTPATQDSIVYFEKDDTFHISIGKEKSRQFLVIACSSTMTSEYRILAADRPDDDFQVFQPRVRGMEYSISHFEDSFYVLTNKDDATNFKLMKTPVSDTEMAHWQDLIPHREDVLLEGIDIFRDFLVVEERSQGLTHIHIKPWDGSGDYYLPFNSETYTAYTTTNPDFETDVLRYAYQSLATPSSVIDFNMRTQEKIVRKEQQVLGETFDKENYVEERRWATAQDGTKVPVSMVYRKGLVKNGLNPTLQYAYGSYGSSMDAHFSVSRLSLLDRGFVYAIAHIRGGEELGRHWYEDGKLLKKKNTFTDFIDCSRFLIEEGYTSASHLYAEGGSAGGLLMGAVINMAPELYHGIIAQVPFVDVVTTMLDEDIPLTTGEYDEWGNPNEKVYYDYMKSYSPYDNVSAKSYPNMYVSTGLHDSQVQYWEPAKWVARLRQLKTDDNLLFLDTNMDAGHGGASGRFEALREVAKEFSFLLHLEKENR